MLVHCNTPTISNTPHNLHYITIHPWSFTVRPLKMMLGRLLSYWEGVFFFKGELLNFGRVSQWNAIKTFSYFTTTMEVMWEIPEDDSEEFRWSARPWVALRAGGPNGSDEKPEIANDLRTLAEVEKGFFPEKYMLQYKALWKLVEKGKLGDCWRGAPPKSMVEFRINLILQPENIPTFEVELEVLWNMNNSVAMLGLFREFLHFKRIFNGNFRCCVDVLMLLRS